MHAPFGQSRRRDKRLWLCGRSARDQNYRDTDKGVIPFPRRAPWRGRNGDAGQSHWTSRGPWPPCSGRSTNRWSCFLGDCRKGAVWSTRRWQLMPAGGEASDTIGWAGRYGPVGCVGRTRDRHGGVTMPRRRWSCGGSTLSPRRSRNSGAMTRGRERGVSLRIARLAKELLLKSVTPTRGWREGPA